MRSVSKSQSEQVASAKIQVSGNEEARDSLREEVCQHLNENLEEHEVVTETVMENDSVRTVRVTERTRTKFQVSSSKFQDSKVAVRKEVVRDTVYVERRDSVLVQESRNYGSTESQSGKTGWHTTLRWVFWIIVAIGVLIGIIKFRV